MGAIAEAFRTWPKTLRSAHPIDSVCARGPLAAEITSPHPLSFSEGPGTPFGRVHDHDGSVLLLGVGFNRCTALHYAETLSHKRRTCTTRFPKIENGETVWIEVPNVADDNDTHFPVIGEHYVARGKAVRGRIGEAIRTTRLPAWPISSTKAARPSKARGLRRQLWTKLLAPDSTKLA